MGAYDPYAENLEPAVAPVETAEVTPSTDAAVQTEQAQQEVV